MIQIYTYGSPVLRVKAAPVENIDADVRKLADAMLKLMLDKKGVGLAAQQVGSTVRVFVMYVPPEYDIAPPMPGPVGKSNNKRLNPDINDPLILLNPVLLSRAGTQSETEGCLSIPEIFSPVHRAYEVSASFLDIGGNQRQIKARGLMARVIQHELDHLDGILFVDRLSTIKKISLAARLKRLKRETEREIAAS